MYKMSRCGSLAKDLNLREVDYCKTIQKGKKSNGTHQERITILSDLSKWLSNSNYIITEVNTSI